MVNKNNNKIKQKKILNEDMNLVKNIIILLIIVVGISLGIYFLTDNMIKKENKSNDTKTETKIDYDIATIGTMFNRVEDEYYVLIYSKENDGNNLDSVLATYRSSDNYIKTYYVDLDKKVNSFVLGEELNQKPSNSNEVKVKEAALYKINNGKVVKCYSGVDNIVNILK